MSCEDDDIAVEAETVSESDKSDSFICELRFNYVNDLIEQSAATKENSTYEFFQLAESASHKKSIYNSEEFKKKKKIPDKEHFFRKPDITSLVLCIMLVVFSAYYILQVYLYDADTLKLIYAEKPASGVVSESAERNSVLMININTAEEDELCELQGIGEARARAIIDYRNKNGNFQTIEEITNVSGIGDGIFNKIKANICVK